MNHELINVFRHIGSVNTVVMCMTFKNQAGVEGGLNIWKTPD